MEYVKYSKGNVLNRMWKITFCLITRDDEAQSHLTRSIFQHANQLPCIFLTKRQLELIFI